MKTSRDVFKIFWRQRNGHLVSWISTGKYKITYKRRGIRNKGVDGSLVLAHKYLKDAKDDRDIISCSCSTNTEIWLCRGYGVKVADYICGGESNRDIDKFWKIYGTTGLFDLDGLAIIVSKGILFCKSVVLKKRVV